MTIFLFTFLFKNQIIKIKLKYNGGKDVTKIKKKKRSLKHKLFWIQRTE